jgi:ADP-ribose pyrophosphatase YjhB (NUDIX family)
MQNNRIIVKAMCLIMNDRSEMLLSGALDKVKGDYFYRPLGGNVEFNERAEDTVKREFVEEINAEITNVELQYIIENIFVCEGIPGHEIDYIFKGDFADKKLYEQKEFSFFENNGNEVKAYWIKPEDCFNGKYRLVPEELHDKLKLSLNH